MNYHNTREFLKSCINKDLDPLVKILIDQSTTSLDTNDIYKKFNPNHSMYVDEIFDDICEFGGNSFANFFRGGGPDYTEIVTDVANDMKVSNIDGDLIRTELQILSKVFELTLENLSEHDKQELLKKLEDEGISLDDIKKLKYLRGPALSAMFKAAPYLIRVVMSIVVKQLGKFGASRVATFGAARYLSVLAGPVGWAIGGVWTAMDIAAPAKRVMIPCVIHIAIIRMDAMNDEINDDYANYL